MGIVEYIFEVTCHFYIAFDVKLVEAVKQVMAMTGIVSEEFKEENYEFWKVCLKSYLVGQGLWDVVTKEATSDDEKAEECQRKNAQALHAIQLSCGSRAYSKYKKSTHVSAKFAWDHLAEMRPTPSHHTEVTQEPDVSGKVLGILLDIRI